MKLSTQIVIAGLLGASLTPIASADVLVSNLGTSAAITPNVSGPWARNLSVFAGQFVTGSSMTEVFEATARLENASGYGFATYEGILYSDDSGSPDSVVATFDSTPSLADGAGTANVSFNSTLGITLDPNTVYWFGVRNTAGNYLGWETTGSSFDHSTAGWSIDDDATQMSSSAGSHWFDRTAAHGGNVFKFSIEGNPVPTPGALALLGTGGLIATRRRRC